MCGGIGGSGLEQHNVIHKQKLESVTISVIYDPFRVPWSRLIFRRVTERSPSLAISSHEIPSVFLAEVPADEVGVLLLICIRFSIRRYTVPFRVLRSIDLKDQIIFCLGFGCSHFESCSHAIMKRVWPLVAVYI